MAAGIIKLTVQVGRFGSTQFDIPVVFNASLSSGTTAFSWVNFFTEMSDADRKKVKIYSSNHVTELKAEIEPGYDFASSKVVYHVKADSIQDGDVFYLDYDSTFAENTTFIGDTGEAPAQAVWNSSFKAVYHMAQDPSGGVGSIKDSTSLANHGTPQNMLSGDLQDGPIGKSLRFNGVDATVIVPYDASLDLDSYNMTVKFRSDTAVGGVDVRQMLSKDENYVLSWDHTAATFQKSVAHRTGTTWYPVSETDSLLKDIWYLFDGTYEPGVATLRLFTDGGAHYSFDGGVPSPNQPSSDLAIGSGISLGVPTAFFDGSISEVRINNINQSAAWILATDYSFDDDMFAMEDYTPTPPGVANQPIITIQT